MDDGIFIRPWAGGWSWSVRVGNTGTGGICQELGAAWEEARDAWFALNVTPPRVVPAPPES